MQYTMQINIVLYSIPYNKLIWNRSAWLIFLPDGLGGLRHVLLQLSLLCFIVNTDFVQLNYDCNFVRVSLYVQAYGLTICMGAS